MKKIFYSIISVAAALSLVSCEKFLTVSPLDQVSADTFFTSEQELRLFANGLIEAYQPTADDIANGSDIASDLTAKRDAAKFWYPGDIYKPSDRGAWSYNNVRRANVLINNMVRAKGKVSDEIYNHYQGVGRFWRAYFIFGKVQAYGDVPWQETLVDPKDSAMLYAPRDDREYVVHKCIEDLQFAVDNCLGDDTYKNVINKWVAAAYLSRIALYEGTYRKYFDVNTSTYKPWTNKYETADQLLQIAVDASKVIMSSGKFQLNASYHDNFVTENLLGNPEMIWVAEYSTGEDATRTHSLTSDFRGSTVGGPSPTKEYVNHFLNIDGTPITNDQIPLYEEMAANNGRDPRLNNNVNHVGLTYKSLSGATYAKWMPCQLTYSGYNLTKWNIEEEQQFQVAKCGNSIPIMRYAEVLLNYA
ncbi:MAG: RagB/SusD family nutrient uptake outer membrane protein, partial [Bacteroidales bacterium]|nr:RagB/SusD family nutrient uptake outer membrane protein [Bacteroidales bacterium]